MPPNLLRSVFAKRYQSSGCRNFSSTPTDSNGAGESIVSLILYPVGRLALGAGIAYLACGGTSSGLDERRREKILRDYKERWTRSEKELSDIVSTFGKH